MNHVNKSNSLFIVVSVATVAVILGIVIGVRRAPHFTSRSPEALVNKSAPRPALAEAVTESTPIEPLRSADAAAVVAVHSVDRAGAPVPAVSIRIASSLESFADEGSRWVTVETDAGGNGTLAREVLSGRPGFWILATHASYAATCICLESKPVLESGTLRVTMAGRESMVIEVFDPRDHPIGNARVDVFGPRGRDVGERLRNQLSPLCGSLFDRGRTDANGTLTLSMAEAVPYHLMVAAEGFLEEAFVFEPSERLAGHKKVRLSELVVAGYRVTDARTGLPSRRSRGRAERTYAWPTAEFSAYFPASWEPSIEEVERSVRERLSAPEVELFFARRSRDDPSKAIAQFRIAPDSMTSTAAYELPFVPVGEFTDAHVVEVPSSCPDEDLAELTVRFTDEVGGAATPQHAWSLAGKLFVVCLPTPREGAFDFVVPPGSYDVRCIAEPFEGSAFKPMTVRLNPGVRQEVSIPLERCSASVRARAVDATGQPVRSWELTAFLETAATTAYETRAMPETRVLSRLPAGRVTLATTALGFPDQFLEIDLMPGEDRDVVFHLR